MKQITSSAAVAMTEAGLSKPCGYYFLVAAFASAKEVALCGVGTANAELREGPPVPRMT